MDHLLIAVLGNRNSGKSTTWNKLFNRTVKTGTALKRLYLNKNEYVMVSLVSGSPEERQTYVGKIIGKQRPYIVLCSTQYTPEVTSTFNFFTENKYFIFCHWLNPGYKDINKVATFDNLGITDYLLSQNSIVGIRNGQRNPYRRVKEIKDFIYGWASSRNLILK